jgi:predicted DNA-binding transcriptional regulator YafY
MVAEAIFHGAVLYIAYKKKSATVNVRSIKPTGWLNNNCVLAVCQRKNEERQFALTRIQHASPTALSTSDSLSTSPPRYDSNKD